MLQLYWHARKHMEMEKLMLYLQVLQENAPLLINPKHTHAPNFAQITWASDTYEKAGDEETQADDASGSGKIRGMH